jgi:hypothetical protein
MPGYRRILQRSDRQDVNGGWRSYFNRRALGGSADEDAGVRELGDASVPFEFDVHAIVRCDDAPALEINKVNPRKAFFRLQLDDIRREFERLNIEVTWTMLAEAREYRETLAVERAIANRTIDETVWAQQQVRALRCGGERRADLTSRRGSLQKTTWPIAVAQDRSVRAMRVACHDQPASNCRKVSPSPSSDASPWTAFAPTSSTRARARSSSSRCATLTMTAGVRPGEVMPVDGLEAERPNRVRLTTPRWPDVSRQAG